MFHNFIETLRTLNDGTDLKFRLGKVVIVAKGIVWVIGIVFLIYALAPTLVPNLVQLVR